MPLNPNTNAGGLPISSKRPVCSGSSWMNDLLGPGLRPFFLASFTSTVWSALVSRCDSEAQAFSESKKVLRMNLARMAKAAITDS